jgi:hypothetical protein
MTERAGRSKRVTATVKATATVSVTGAVTVARLGAAAVAVSLLAAGCVSNSGLLVILQNQQPTVDETSQVCSAGSTVSASAVGSGVLDLEVYTLPASAPSYLAYPLVQNTLPPRAETAGAVEPNAVVIDGIRGTLYPPPGFDISWPDGCPGTFFSPSTAGLLPGLMVGFTAQIVRPCQAQVIHDLFASKDLPSDLSQEVVFTADMRAVGRLMSNDEITSDSFRFSIRMCIGCLQTGFADLAQFNFPSRPPCTVAPKPNPHHGNPCNAAQDYGPLLCCTGDMGQIVCPAYDM